MPDLTAVKSALRGQQIELPSWAFGNSGTRLKVFGRPLLAGLREDLGLDPDPVAAYHRSGYADKIVANRVGGTPAGWGS